MYYSEGLAIALVRGKGEGFKVAIPLYDNPDRLDKDKMVDALRKPRADVYFKYSGSSWYCCCWRFTN